MRLGEAHGIRQYFTASEAPWQNGLVERNGGFWKAVARKAIEDVGAQGFVEMRRLASTVNWAKNARINLFWIRAPLSECGIGRGFKLRWSPFGREAERRTGIAGVATRSSSDDECHGCGLTQVIA